jgi:hypothetical protein
MHMTLVYSGQTLQNKQETVATPRLQLLEYGDTAALNHFSIHVASSSEYKGMNGYILILEVLSKVLGTSALH